MTIDNPAMPTTMPRIVSNDRRRFVQTAWNDIAMFSEKLRVTFYSARSAVTGSSFAARLAGYQPETMPTALETPTARTT